MSDEFEKLSHQSTVQFAIEAIRALLLVNGGGVVALLTFCGNVATSTKGPPLVNLGMISWSLQSFAWGLAAAVAVTFGSYLAQTAFTHTWVKTGIGIQVASVLMALLSLLLFVLGAANAGLAFRV